MYDNNDVSINSSFSNYIFGYMRIHIHICRDIFLHSGVIIVKIIVEITKMGAIMLSSFCNFFFLYNRTLKN